MQEYDGVSHTVSEITRKVNGAQLLRRPVYGIIDKAENQGTLDTAFWIDDYRYPIAYNLEPAALKIGDVGTFYQDAIGNITWYDTDTPITLRLPVMLIYTMPW